MSVGRGAGGLVPATESTSGSPVTPAQDPHLLLFTDLSSSATHVLPTPAPAPPGLTSLGSTCEEVSRLETRRWQLMNRWMDVTKRATSRVMEADHMSVEAQDRFSKKLHELKAILSYKALGTSGSIHILSEIRRRLDPARA
jgi:hypothetical protein